MTVHSQAAQSRTPPSQSATRSCSSTPPPCLSDGRSLAVWSPALPMHRQKASRELSSVTGYRCGRREKFTISLEEF